MKKNPTDYLVTPDLNKPDGWIHPIRHSLIAKMRGISNLYYHLAHDQQNLRDVVRGRTVGIMLHGASINEFERRIKEFADLDLCYLSVNRFEVMERKILSRIGKRLEIVFCMSEQEMPRRIRDINQYLDRGNGLFMTTFSALSWLKEAEYTHILKNHDDHLYIMPRLRCRPVYPISLALVLDELAQCGVQRAVLFGTDGYIPDNGDGEWNQQKMLATYYDPGFFVKENRPSGLALGTRHFNETFQYDRDNIAVVNCSPKSHLVHFPKIGYGQLRRALEWK